MKKYILLFFLLSLLPCLSTACSDDDGSSTPNLTVGKETVDFNSESGSQNVAVTTNVDTWTVKSDKNIIVGNTVLYGATSGEFYANQIKIGATRQQTGRH